MALKYEIIYHADVVKLDIPRLDKVNRERVERAITTKLTTRPELFGVPLRQSLKGSRKLRVGNIRIVFRLKKRQVLIFAIIHRATVYKDVKTRFSNLS